MNVFSRLALVATLMSVILADHDSQDHDHDERHLHVELLETWYSFEFGISTIGIEYNSDDNLYYIVSSYNLTAGEISTLSGDYPATSDDIDIQQDVMDQPAPGFATTSVYTGNSLYIAGGCDLGGCTGDVGGFVYEYNTETSEYVATLSTDYSLTSVCQDPDNLDMLYITGGGIDFSAFSYVNPAAGLWSVDTSAGDDISGATVTRLYDGTNATTNGFAANYVFNPTRCQVKDGVVYMVEWKLDATGSLATYDIESGALAYDNSVLSVSCDGLIYSDDAEAWLATYFPISDISGTSLGALLVLDTTEDDAVFETVLDGLQAPQDIAIGPDNTVAITSAISGNVWFVEIEVEGGESSGVAKMGVVGALTVIVAAML